MGAEKKDQGKERLSEIFKWLDRAFLLDVAKVLEFGARKYEVDQWKKGFDDETRLIDAILRHIVKYQSGQLADEESGLSHLAHATASLMFLHYYDRQRVENENKDNE